MAVVRQYVPAAGLTASDSIGWTCQQPGRLLDDPIRLSVAADTKGSARDVGVGAADVLDLLQ